jgi:hypothetical protein
MVESQIVGNNSSSSDPVVRRNFDRDFMRDPRLVGRVMQAGLMALDITPQQAPGLHGLVKEIEDSRAYKPRR